jgi:hypothetical protein
MSYQTPDIWKEHDGQYGKSWRASWDEVEAVYPELIKNLEKVNGAVYDDGAKYRYKVTYKAGYDYTIWRNEKKRGGGGNFNRPRQFQQTAQQPQQQQKLTDDEVSFQEDTTQTLQEMLRLLQEIAANIKVTMEHVGAQYFNRATDLGKNDHGNERGGDNAAGLGMDILNAEREADDGLPQVDTPSGVAEIDTIAGPEQVE